MNKLLIIEDGSSLCEEVSVFLKKAGYFVPSVMDFTDIYGQMMPVETSVFVEDLGSTVILHFRDNGIGIIESDLPYVFDKSFTGHIGRKSSEATGMELYIVKKSM